MKFKLAPLALLAAAPIFAQNYYGYNGDRYAQHQDLRGDYRDVHHDYARVDRLRNDVARDQYRLNEALRRGDERAAGRIARDMARDQRRLYALHADIDRDQRDIHHDQRRMYRDDWR